MKVLKKALILINQLCHWIALPLLCIACLIARWIPKKIQIGLGPLPMINNVYWKKALVKKRYTAETYVTDCYYITEEFDFRFDRGWRKIYFFIPGLLFVRTIFRYQCVYVYFNGGPLQLIPGLRLIEPVLYRLAKVKTVVMPYGSDSQVLLETPNKLMVNALCADYPGFFRHAQGKIRRQINAWCRHADIAVGAMDSVDYLPFWNRIRHCHFAIDTDAIQPSFPEPGEKIKILHAPNHKEVKGSRFVIRAVEELKAEGYPIELLFKQGITNSEFLKLVKEADIVVDQLIMGWYAMFSMEAMACGKPVLCAMRKDLIALYENVGCVEPGEFPMLDASPVTIKDVLRSLIEHKEDLKETGRKSRAFVERYHSLNAVGDFFDEINRSLDMQPKS